MKNLSSKPNISNGLLVFALATIFGIVGCAFAYSQFMVYEIPWQNHRLPSPPRGTVQIVHIQIKSFADDPKGDTVYVETENSTIYSYTLFEDAWLSVDEIPDSDFQISDTCAPDWPGAQSGADIWDPPPVEKNVLDSDGERIEHAIAIFVRCYVLSDDGSLELWTREDSALAIIAFLQCGLGYAFIGILLGIIIGTVVIRFKKRKMAGGM